MVRLNHISKLKPCIKRLTLQRILTKITFNISRPATGSVDETADHLVDLPVNWMEPSGYDSGIVASTTGEYHARRTSHSSSPPAVG